MDEDIYVPYVPFVTVVVVTVVVVVHHHRSIQSRSTRDIHPRAEGLIWILDFYLKMTNPHIHSSDRAGDQMRAARGWCAAREWCRRHLYIFKSSPICIVVCKSTDVLCVFLRVAVRVRRDVRRTPRSHLPPSQGYWPRQHVPGRRRWRLR